MYQSTVVLLVWLTMLGSASAANFWALTADQHLVRFTSSAPGTILLDLPITGLPAGERIIGIQALSLDGSFVGVGSSGRTYSLDRHTGAATVLPVLPVTETAGVPVGTFFGMTQWGDNITSVPHMLQIVSDSGSIMQMGVGGWAGTSAPNYTPTGHWVAVSWFIDPGSGHGVQFVIDSTSDSLYSVDVPSTFRNAASVTTVGALDVDVSDLAGMAGDFHDGTLYAALTVSGVSWLYTLDKTTGHATLIGAIGAATPIASLTLDFQTTPWVTSPPFPGGFVAEGNAPLTYTIHRNGDDLVPADYVWETLETGVGLNYATAGQDFVLISQTVHFNAGEIEKTVAPVQVVDDAVREANERFSVRIREAVSHGVSRTLDFQIVDNDNRPPATVTVTSPVDPWVSVLGSTITISGTVTDEDPGVVIDASYPSRISPFYAPFKTATASGSSWTLADVPLFPGLQQILIGATDIFGLRTAAAQPVTVVRSAPVDQSFVFAEGATGGFFHTDLLFGNPNAAEVPVTIEFMREDGTVIPYALTLPPNRRVTLDVGSIPGLEATSTAAVVRTSSYPIVVERTMTWDRQGYGASGEKGASALSTTWLFAEGSQGFFKTFLLLVNPQASDNDVSVRFLREGTGPVTKTFHLSPHQRLTIDAGSIPELVNQSFGMEVTFTQPGVAERSMYFGDSPLWTAGHESAGAPAAANVWYLAEGATGQFFTTFLLLANPSNAPVDASLIYLPSSGVPVNRTRTVPANGRLTINIATEDPTLADTAVATELSAPTPIVVERSQYWPYTPDQWYEAHNSFGQTAPGFHWGLAEGRVGGPSGYQTYILLANPALVPVHVMVRFLRDDGGAPVIKRYTIPALTRFNLPVDSTNVPEISDTTFAVDIVSDLAIMVERSMYSNAIGQIWAAGTNATATRLP